MNTLLLFIILNAVNVFVQTIKSICTVKSGKTVAALVNAVAYGIYTVVLVYMTCELPLWEKVVIVGGCNLVCVWVVKFLEEKMAKDRLWKISATISQKMEQMATDLLNEKNLSFSLLDIENGDYKRFEIYSATQAESIEAKKILEAVGAKYFVSESKTL